LPTAAEVKELGDATANQREQLRQLIADKAVADSWTQRFYASVLRAQGLTSTAATDALFYLNTLATAGEQPDLALPAQADALRHLVRTRVVPVKLATRLLARLDDGVASYIEADRAIVDWLRMPPRTWFRATDVRRPAGTRPPEMSDGYFALIASADGRPRCFRIRTRDYDSLRIIEQITGEQPERRRRLYGYQATQVLREIEADPAAAAKLYARTRGRCSACNTKLEKQDQPGYEHGYGPDCWAARQQNPPPGNGDQP
jgi:hypothetical protein